MAPKRARGGKAPASAASVLRWKSDDWNELEEFFWSMERRDLLLLLGKAWESDDMRKTLAAGVSKTWTNAGDQQQLLNYDWILSPTEKDYVTPKVIKLNSTKSGKTKVELPGYAGNWELDMETIRGMENLDGDAFEYEDDDMGCEECGAPGSFIRLELQRNRAWHLRLRVVATCCCGCLTMYNQISREESEHFYYAGSDSEVMAAERKAKK